VVRCHLPAQQLVSIVTYYSRNGVSILYDITNSDQGAGWSWECRSGVAPDRDTWRRPFDWRWQNRPIRIHRTWTLQVWNVAFCCIERLPHSKIRVRSHISSLGREGPRTTRFIGIRAPQFASLTDNTKVAIVPNLIIDLVCTIEWTSVYR
jgi:hypothetical protein